MNDKILDYERITDDLYWMSLGGVVRFSVSLARKNEDGTRRFFHREVEYNSKYIDKRRVTSVKRSFDYYIHFEITNNPDAFVMIRVSDIIALRNSLAIASKWFSTCFALSDDKIIIKGAPKPEMINNLPMGRYIQLEPTVVKFDEQQVPGIRMFLSRNDLYIDITVDKFMGLVYIINTIDMHSTALAMINSLGGTPYGTNYYAMSVNDNEAVLETGVSNMKKREIPKQKKNVSFFDKMNELGG